MYIYVEKRNIATAAAVDQRSSRQTASFSTILSTLLTMARRAYSQLTTHAQLAARVQNIVIDAVCAYKIIIYCCNSNVVIYNILYCLPRVYNRYNITIYTYTRVLLSQYYYITLRTHWRTTALYQVNKCIVRGGGERVVNVVCHLQATVTTHHSPPDPQHSKSLLQWNGGKITTERVNRQNPYLYHVSHIYTHALSFNNYVFNILRAQDTYLSSENTNVFNVNTIEQNNH